MARGAARLGRAFEALFRLHWTARVPGGLARGARRRRGRGHRPGVVSRGGAGARPLRPQASRSAPGCTGSWSTARSTRPASRALRREVAAPARRPTSRQPSAPPQGLSDELIARPRRARRPSSAPWWRCATCSSTRRGRSRALLELPARHRELAPAPRARSPGRRCSTRRRPSEPARRELEARLRRLAERPLPGERDARERGWSVICGRLRRRRSGLVPPRALRPLALARGRRRCPGGARPWPSARPEPAWATGSSSASTRAPDTATPAFAGLPAAAGVLLWARGGSLGRPPGRLVSAAWAPSREAGWSPRGKFVIGVRGRRLVAVDPDRRRCAGPSRARGRCTHPAWSGGDGYRVAYLEGDDAARRRGETARATGCSGGRRRRSRPPGGPGGRWVLSYAGAGGLIETVDVDTGRRALGAPYRAQAGLRAGLDPGRRGGWWRSSRTACGSTTAAGAPWPPGPLPRARGRSPSIPAAGGRRSRRAGGAAPRFSACPCERSGAARSLFDGFGRVDGLAWSPDGRRLLLAWRDADQWLLLGPRRQVQRALARSAASWAPGRASPRIAGWCCPR